MDIERFPTNETAKRMLGRVSPIYEHSYVAKWLYQVMGIEMEEARLYFEELRSQSFPETATWGIPYWEQRYGLPVDDTLSIEERRQRITSKRGLRAPMNPSKVEQVISDLCGKSCAVTEDNKNYQFGVSVYNNVDDTEVHFDAIKTKLKEIKPSHLSFLIKLQFDPIFFKNKEKFDFGIYGQISNFKNFCERVSIPQLFINIKAKQNYSFKGEVVIDNMFCLDGSFQLNGTKKLNASITKEEL